MGGLAFTVDFERAENISLVQKLVRAAKGKVTLYTNMQMIEQTPDNYSFLRDLCVCVHGYSHVHLSQLGYVAQMLEINQAVRTFDWFFGRKPRGWRSPYLDFNKETFNVLKLAGFEWDSSYKRSPITWLRKLQSPIKLIPIDARTPVVKEGTIMVHCYELTEEMINWVAQQPNLITHDELARGKT